MMHSVEAEQALLGALLINNDVFPRVADVVKAADFYDPVHVRVFDAIASKINRGELASPVTLKVYFDGDEGLAALGGPAYLARMGGAAISIFAARDYAKQVRDLAAKRRLADALDRAKAELMDAARDCSAAIGIVEAHALAEQASGAMGSSEIVSFAAAITAAVTDEINARTGEGPQPMRSGIPALDAMLGGFYPGDLVILAGRPGMGKSSVALSFALNAARAGHGVALASLEMTPASLGMRAIAEGTDRIGRGVPYADARRGVLGEAQAETFIRTAQTMMSLPIKIIPPSMRDLGGLYAATKRCAAMFSAKETPMGALVVDYLQLIKSAKASRYEEITEISIALKQMALQLGVPVIALSQLSRAVEQREDKRPIMSDLRESGQLEQDADAILFCYRAEYYLRQERPEDGDHEAMVEYHDALSRCAGWLDIIVAKQRMGETGTVRVRFDERFNAIRGGAA